MAFHGVDLRDLYRPGSGLTLRRLFVLLRGLRWMDSPLWHEIEAAQKAALIPKADEIRERQAAWKARNDARLAREREAAS